MGSIRPAKTMVTVVTICVLLFVAATTSAASMTNSTLASSVKDDGGCLAYNQIYGNEYCLSIGYTCFNLDKCCCWECDEDQLSIPLDLGCAIYLYAKNVPLSKKP